MANHRLKFLKDWQGWRLDGFNWKVIQCQDAINKACSGIDVCRLQGMMMKPWQAQHLCINIMHTCRKHHNYTVYIKIYIMYDTSFTTYLCIIYQSTVYSSYIMDIHGQFLIYWDPSFLHIDLQGRIFVERLGHSPSYDAGRSCWLDPIQGAVG